MPPLKTAFAAAIVSFAWAYPAKADLHIYEPFDYPTTGNTDEDGAYFGDGTQSGALGLTGAWATEINNIEMEVRDEAMTFTDGGGNVLPAAGLSILRSNRSGFCTNSISVEPSVTASLTGDNTTMWISFLYVDEGFSGPDSSVMLASEPLALANNHSLSAAGYGVGILIGENTPDEDTSAVETGYYLNSTTATRSTSTLYPHGVAGATEGDVFLLAAKINWKPDGTPDEIFVFNITDLTTEPQEEDAIASDTFDMPLTAQQALDTLNIGETQVDAFDEIRFGDTFADVVGGAAPTDTLKLTIAPNATAPGNYDFEWESQDGKLYDLVSSTDLSTAPASWPVWLGNENIVGAAPENMLSDVPGGGDSKRFFAVVEKAPPSLLSEDFEAVTGPNPPTDWSAVDNSAGATAWQVGTPFGALTGPPAAAKGTQCAGTNISADYTPSAVASLITKAFTVPAGGATLNFSQYIDTEPSPSGDLGSIRLLNAGDNSILVGGDIATGLEGITEAWSSQSIDLPAVANGLSVKIEFRFESDADTEAYAGFYIDNVEVIAQ